MARTDYCADVSNAVYHLSYPSDFSGLCGCDERFATSIADAKSRYHYLYNKSYINRQYQELLDKLFLLWYKASPKISFSDDSFDVVFTYNNHQVTFDINFDEPDVIFVSTFKCSGDDKKLCVKDCSFENYMDILERLDD